jgi:UDP-2,3-diacylglucosamine hydrolase
MIYFVSDFHFGIPDHDGSLAREKLFVAWLDKVKTDAEVIYLMGDLFDFWFEYRTVIPKGYARLLGKLAELTDLGIPVHLFRGNHDLWAFSYFKQELGIELHRSAEIRVHNGKKFFLAHGDGLGPGDKGYKILKSIFESKLNQFLYRWIHPDIGTRLGSYFSRRSRLTKMITHGTEYKMRHPVEMEPMVIFSREMAARDKSIDYFVFGHYHVPHQLAISETANCIILGDWITRFSYAQFDGEKVEFRQFFQE